MGVTLSEPVTEKETSVVENRAFKAGSSSMQGWRVSMEDAHCMQLAINNDAESAFFGVFDGHGGSAIAHYANENLMQLLLASEEFKNSDIPGAMKKVFLELDSKMQTLEKLRDGNCGTTALTVLLLGKKLYCGNVGDSRGIASVQGEVQELSFDHKPSNKAEEQRIYAAGGYVDFNRVNGNLALSRAFGDFNFKNNPDRSPEEQVVIALPDVVTEEITQEHEFIVMACDGIWDVMTNQEVVDFVRVRLAKGASPDDVCEQLMMRCLAPDTAMGGLGCDNMTVIIICLLFGQSWDEFCSRCATKSRVPPGGYALYERLNKTKNSELF